MGGEAAAARYEPGPAFEEVKEEAMLDISPTESQEFWLIQWIRDKDLDVPGFHGKELSLKLHKDGNLGSLENSSGKPYDLVSFAYQQPDATVFLPSGSEMKAVGKISRRVCLVRHRHREPEKMEKPNFGSLIPSRKKKSAAALPSDTSCQGPPQYATNKRRGRKNRKTRDRKNRKRKSLLGSKLATNGLPTCQET